MLPLNVSATIVNEADLSLASPALPSRIVVNTMETKAFQEAELPYLFLQGYYTLFPQTGMQHHPWGSLWISRENWLKDSAIQCLNLCLIEWWASIYN